MPLPAFMGCRSSPQTGIGAGTTSHKHSPCPAKWQDDKDHLFQAQHSPKSGICLACHWASDILVPKTLPCHRLSTLLNKTNTRTVAAWIRLVFLHLGLSNSRTHYPKAGLNWDLPQAFAVHPGWLGSDHEVAVPCHPLRSWI